MAEKILVCGANGYVGRHLVNDLVAKGHEVYFVSRRTPEGLSDKANWLRGDLFDIEFCKFATEGVDWVYNLAATVGGIGFIGQHPGACMSSAAININLLRSLQPGIKGYFFASSSCVYPSQLEPLKEGDVIPSQLSGYGLEKYFSEKVALAFAGENNIPVRIARLHTVYGPGDFRGYGRDHFPTAMVQQVVQAVHSKIHEIKIWGDGNQTRSLLYIDDAVEGIQRVMNNPFPGPVNLASSELVSVNSLVSGLEDIAAVKLTRFYCPQAAVGAQNKTADTTNLRQWYGWEPMTPARVGMERLFRSAWERSLKS